MWVEAPQHLLLFVIRVAEVQMDGSLDVRQQPLGQLAGQQRGERL